MSREVTADDIRAVPLTVPGTGHVIAGINADVVRALWELET